MPYASCDEVLINYEVRGQGEPLVLLTGLGGDTSFWNVLVDLISEEYTVITLDNRGAGKTKYGDAPFKMEDLASDVKSVLNCLGIKKTHVLGWSMGGNIAQQFAVDYPKMTASLVLVSTYTRRPARSSIAIDTMIDSVRQGASMDSLSLMMQAFCLTESVFWRREKEGRPTNGKQTCTIEGFAHQKMALDAFDGLDNLKLIKAPTLAIHGKADIMVPYHFGDDLASKIEGAKMIHIEEAGHIIPPKLYHRHVSEHLRAHTLGKTDS